MRPLRGSVLGRHLFVAVMAATGCGDSSAMMQDGGHHDAAAPSDGGSDAASDASVDASPRRGWHTTADHFLKPLDAPDSDRFEDAGYFDPTVIYHDGQYLLFVSTLRVHVSRGVGDQVIKRATSRDGVSWTLDPEPVLVPSVDGWDSGSLETPEIAIVPDERCLGGTRYLLFYNGYSELVPGLGIPEYEIGLAKSCNGHSFSRLAASESPYGQEGLVATLEDAYPGFLGTVSDPDVVVTDDGMLMFVSSWAWVDRSGDGAFQDDEQRAFGIVTMRSAEGTVWTPLGDTPATVLGVDAQQPSVLRIGGQLRMWYTADKGVYASSDRSLVPVSASGNSPIGFAVATSEDGIAWTLEDGYDLRWDPSRPPDHYGWFTGVEAVHVEGQLQLVTTGVFPAAGALLEHTVQNTSEQGAVCPDASPCSVRANSGLSLWRWSDG